MTTVTFNGAPRRSRNLAERLMVRLPGLWRAGAVLMHRLPPRSRLRRALLRRELISAYAAASRRDYQLMLVRYAPDVEIVFDPDLQALGVAGTFRGHAALVTALEQIGEGVEDWDMRPAVCFDTGDRIVTLGHVRLPGRASGLVFETEFAQVLTLRRGVVATEHEFWSWEKGLRAAGLDPDALALPTRPAGRPAVRKPG